MAEKDGTMHGRERDQGSSARGRDSKPSAATWSFGPLPPQASLRATKRGAADQQTSLDDDGQARSLEAFGVILQMVREATGLRFAAIAHVTANSWSACAVSSSVVSTLHADQPVPAATTLCSHVRDSGRPLACDYLPLLSEKLEEYESGRSFTLTGFHGFQCYVGVPIVLNNGEFFGTLCAMDTIPSTVSSQETLSFFESCAQLLRLQLDAEDRLRENRVALRSEQDTAELRDQFIAVLGHDLRTPLTAISLGVQSIERFTLEPRISAIAARIGRSSARMSALIDSILDFARGRLGGGMQLSRQLQPDLRGTLLQVISELHSAHPQRQIEVRDTLTHQVSCDGERVAQLLSNLLGNALHHGTVDTPVLVDFASDAQCFTIAVTNQCAPIPDDVLPRLFSPFYRRTDLDQHQGLGLGLYIASQIADAHNGTLAVRSDMTGTTFTLNVPTSSSA